MWHVQQACSPRVQQVVGVGHLVVQGTMPATPLVREPPSLVHFLCSLLRVPVKGLIEAVSPLPRGLGLTVKGLSTASTARGLDCEAALQVFAWCELTVASASRLCWETLSEGRACRFSCVCSVLPLQGKVVCGLTSEPHCKDPQCDDGDSQSGSVCVDWSDMLLYGLT